VRVKSSAVYRKFTLSDVMVLVAATAIGMAGYRSVVASFPFFHAPSTVQAYHGGTLRLNILCSVPIIAVWSFAVLALQIRWPRPAFHLLARQPGFGACQAALLWTMFAVLGVLIRKLSLLTTSPPRQLEDWDLLFRLQCMSVVGGVGPTVIAIWWLMALSRRRHSPSHAWAENLGRALGVLWIMLYLVYQASV